MAIGRNIASASTCIADPISIVQEHRRISKALLDQVHGRACSTAAFAAMIDCDPTHIPNYTKRLAATIVSFDRAAKHSLESAIVNSCSSDDLLIYVDCYRSDETPMKVRSSSNLATTSPRLLVDSRVVLPAQDQLSMVLQQLFPILSAGEKCAITRKLLQSETKFGIVFKATINTSCFDLDNFN
jgi:hypothetical protein